MGKKINLILLSLICFFLLNITTRALSIPADGQWHDTGINFNPTRIAGYNGAQPSCSCSDSNISVHPKQTDNHLVWTCEAQTSKEGNYSIKYGIIDTTGSFVEGGTVTLAVSNNSTNNNSNNNNENNSTKKSGIDYGSDPKYTGNGDCKIGALGDPSDNKSVAYYLQIIFNVIKFIGPILVILFTIKDLLFMTAEQKMDGEIPKIGKKTIKRVIYAALIFFLPILINMILRFIGLYTICIS